MAEPPETAAAARAELRARRFVLRVIEGPDTGMSYTSDGPVTVIGTHETAQLRLTDPTVSRFHCELRVHDGNAMLTDLGSRNGTRVGDVVVHRGELAGAVTLALGRTKVWCEPAGDHVVVPLSERTRFGLLVGQSRAIRAVFRVLERAAGCDLPLLLQGETGTGKDLAAQSVHQESARARGPLVVVDCGSLPPGLLESELFGHEQGAFTGASARRIGAFEAAAGGTIFLDEIGELSLDLQPKLLRALEAKRIRRVGGREDIAIDARVIAATNRNLREEVNARRFRSDLYFRIAVLELVLPPLRERPDDLPLIRDEILAAAGASEAETTTLRSDEVLQQLVQHAWPGNARELRNYLERALALNEAAPITAGDGPPTIDAREKMRVMRKKWLDYFETRYLRDLLATHGDNISAAARAAGIDRVHLYRMLARNGLR